MPTLPSGDVVPAFLEVMGGTKHYDGGNFTNFQLRVGEVKEIVWPDDERSRSKKFTEYRVYVQQRSNGTVSGKVYENCVLVNPLAGLADRARWNLRADTKKDSTKTGVGSKVLVLCVNGETNTAVIVGGLRDPGDAKDKGTARQPLHDAEVVFNGIRFYVNDDGELEVKYTGKSKADGTTDASKDVVGARLLLDKDGGILIVDGAGTTGIYVDHKKGKIIVQRDKALEIGDATDFMLLGQSFRQAQQAQNLKLEAQLQALQTSLVTAATALNTAGTSMSVPITGAVAAAPQIAVAGAALQAAAQIAGQMKQALVDFEQAAGQKNSFLSKLNKLD